MTLTLHIGRGTVAMAVHAALEEVGADYRTRWVDMRAGEQRGPAYLALNPKGRVPALETPAGVLTEVPALMDWIAATHPDAGLMPADPFAAARAREAMAYLASTVHVSHAHRLRASRWSDDPETQASMAAKVPANMAEHMAYLEGRLTGDWIAGVFSAADLHLWVVLRWVPGDGVDMAPYPRLRALHDRVTARPAVARVIEAHG